MTDERPDKVVQLKAWRETRNERAQVWAGGWSLRSLLLLLGRDWYDIEDTQREWREEREARRRAVQEGLREYTREEIEVELLEIARYADSPIGVLRIIYPKETTTDAEAGKS
jgi:hypothetical protein